MADQLREIVGRMVEAGESEEDIALVIQRLSHQEPEPQSHAERLKTGLAAKGGLSPDMASSLVDGLMGGGVMASPLAIVGQQGPRFIQGIARRLYGGLLKPKQGLKDSFGDAKQIAGTLLDERAAISKGGAKKMQGRVADSRNTAMGMVQKADAQGMQGVTPKDVTSEFKPVVETLRRRADIGQPSELPKVGARGKAIVNTASRHGGDIPLTRAQGLKEEAQEAAAGAYRVRDTGAKKQLGADDLLDEAVAKGLRKGIERQVPGVGPQNARTQRLLGGRNAVEDAVEREANNNMVGGMRDIGALIAGFGGTAVGGPGLGAVGAGIVRGLATPSIGSRVAIGLNEASRLGLDDAVQRALMVVMSQGSHEQ